MDQRLGSYTCKTKSKRWTMTVFSYILDVSRVNASTLLALDKRIDPRKQDSYDFGMDLAFMLIRPHIQRRPLAGLQENIKAKISLLLGHSDVGKRKSSASELEQLHPKKNCKTFQMYSVHE